MAYEPSFADRLRLAALFIETDEAGYGVFDGTTFEAYPGMEDAAADFIEARLNTLGGA